MLPNYNDGKLELYELVSNNETFEEFELVDLHMPICFLENSVGDRVKNELGANGIEITTKITIPQYKKIDSTNVVKIEDKYHQVYNAYHFENTDGIKQTTLTLMRYKK